MSEAIEAARDFRGLMERIEADAKRLQQLVGQHAEPDAPDERRYTVVPARQPGENRAAHRARLKRERREAKSR